MFFFSFNDIWLYINMAVTTQDGTNICLWDVTAKAIFDGISRHWVTHMGWAPTILSMAVNAAGAERRPLPGKVAVMTGGAPPPPEVLFRMESLGFQVTHSCGMTETYGPGAVCTWKPEWDELHPNERAKMKARQGLHHLWMEQVDIKNPQTMEGVPADGKTIGEIMFRGNTVMKRPLMEAGSGLGTWGWETMMGTSKWRTGPMTSLSCRVETVLSRSTLNRFSSVIRLSLRQPSWGDPTGGATGRSALARSWRI